MSEIEIDRSEPGVAILRLAGEHEIYSTPRINADLEALVREGVSIVVDLSEAAFLDSTVVAALLRAHKEAAARGLGFALVVDDSTGSSVRRLFALTGLETVFDIVRDRADAVAAVRAA